MSDPTEAFSHSEEKSPNLNKGDAMKLSDVCRAIVKLKQQHAKETQTLIEDYETNYQKLSGILLDCCRETIKHSDPLKEEMRKENNVEIRLGEYIVGVEVTEEGYRVGHPELIEHTINMDYQINGVGLEDIPSGLFREGKSEFACSQSDVDFTKQED